MYHYHCFVLCAAACSVSVCAATTLHCITLCTLPEVVCALYLQLCTDAAICCVVSYVTFGLCSAPFLFNQLSIAIHWILQHKYSVHHLLSYLDHFLLLAHQAPLNVRKTLMQCYHYAKRSMLLLCSPS